MLTKNFYSFMRAALQGVSAEFTKVSGNTTYMQLSSATVPLRGMSQWSGVAAGYGVAVGTGTTPPTMSDYVLESILGNTQISVVTPNSVSFSRGDNFDEYSVSFGITNITDEAITISEVGLTAVPQNAQYVLVDRSALDTPVTIPPHETKHIAYTIRFNYGDVV